MPRAKRPTREQLFHELADLKCKYAALGLKYHQTCDQLYSTKSVLYDVVEATEFNHAYRWHAGEHAARNVDLLEKAGRAAYGPFATITEPPDPGGCF